jgi:nucleoside-diphosphate-sugar epimerase
MAQKKLLVTGAAGTVAGMVISELEKDYELVLLDVRDCTADGQPLDNIHLIDLTDTNRDSYRHLFEGCDAVVHFGFVGDSNPDNTPSADQRFQHEMANVQMAYNIYQTSLEAGVGRVIMASSNHAADYFEPLILDHQLDIVDPDLRALSDNYYGWAKEAYEHLGFVFAVGRQVSAGTDLGEQPLENIQLRIGGPREDDLENCAPGDMRTVRRALAAYLSTRDLVQLVVRSIETADIRNNDGVPFQIFYGISGNSHAIWSIANARRVIGYEPQDNSEIRFADQVARHIDAYKKASGYTKE